VIKLKLVFYTHFLKKRVFSSIIEESGMVVSYKKLWKLLIDKDLMKKDLQSNAGVSWATITKMSKGETVSTEVLMKICKYLQCDVGDIMEFIDADKSEDKTK